VDWLRQASEEARNGTNKAAERAACGFLTKLTSSEPENETVNHNSAEVLVANPWHVEGVHPLTSASIQVTSLGWPGPPDVMTGRRIGRSSPPHPAQSAKW
jgi:hypothetical protein